MIRLERRADLPRWLNWAIPIGSILAALVAGSVLILASGNSPFSTYSRIIDRAFVSSGAFSATLIAATPLLFTGLAASAAFKMGVFNIGGQGQYVMGSISASAVGLAWGESLGKGVIPLMIMAAIVAGAAWAGIAGALRAYLSTNEIITSLMLNYIAANLGSWLIFNSRSYWRLLTGSGLMFPQGKRLPETSDWPLLGLGSVSVPFGFLVGMVFAAGTYVLYRHTRFGFEVEIIGDSPAAASYAGMRTRRKVLAVMAISGALAGVGGASDVGDFRHILDPKGLGQSGYGYTGIVIAALARLNPIAVIVVAVFMGGLDNAGRALQGPGFPAGLVGTLQGLVLFFALGGEILARYRIRRAHHRIAGPVASALAPGTDSPGGGRP